MLQLLFWLLFSSLSSAEIKSSGADLQEDSYREMTTSCVQTCMDLINSLNSSNKDNPAYENEFKINCKLVSDKRKKQDDVSAFYHLLAESYNVSTEARRCLQNAAKNVPVGVAKGLYELGLLVWDTGKAVIKGVPELPGTIYDSFKNSSLSAQKREQLRKDCSHSASCTRRVARGLLRFQEMTGDGNFRASNSEVDTEIQKIKKQHPNNWFDRLWTTSLRDSNQARAECERQLGDVMNVEWRKHNEWSDAGRNRILNNLRLKNPACPAILSSNNIDLARLLQTPTQSKDILPKITATPPKPNAYEVFKNLAACKGQKNLSEFLEYACTATGEGAGKLLAGGPEIKAVQMTAAGLRGSQTLKGLSGLNAEARAAQLTADGALLSDASKKFISQYGTKVHVPTAENQKFIGLAHASNAGKLDADSVIFVTQENSIMKKLNTKLGNKDMVTALTTFQQERYLAEIKKLKAQYPELDFTDYQDFKSIQNSIRVVDPKKFTPQRRELLLADLDRALLRANMDLKTEMDRLGVNTAGLGSPDTWFRGGIGTSADRANLAARYARGTDNQKPGFTNYDAGTVKAELTAVLSESEKLRAQMVAAPHFKTLLSTADGAPVPRSDVFDLVRKHGDSQDLATALSNRYGLRNFNSADAALLQRYAKSVDQFSPSILIAKRESLDLSDARLGVVSADFVGLGGDNMRATAASMAGRNSVDAAVVGARKNEGLVTNTFNARKERFRKIIGDGSQCSGDDCVQVVKTIMTNSDKTRTMDRIARDPLTSQVRMTFVGPGVAPEHRMILVTQGEAIEKALRKKLEGQVDYSKLKNLTFGLDMNTVRTNEGVVNLVIGKKRTTSLSSTERIHIQRAFEDALSSVNQDGSDFAAGFSQAQQLRLKLLPNPAGLVSDDEE